MLRGLRAYERAANSLHRSYLGGLRLRHTRIIRPSMAAKKYPEAEIEFRKILENRGLVHWIQSAPLRVSELARTLVLVGEAAKAKSA